MDPKFITITVSVLVITVVGIITYFKWAYSYWKVRNLFYFKPKIPFGNFENITTMDDYVGIRFKNLYNMAKLEKQKHMGIYFFSLPLYFPLDPQIIKNILQKDFDHFTDRGVYYNEKDDPLSANIFTLGGEKWRKIRSKLSPAFTSGKLKMMFETLIQCGYQLSDAVNNSYGSNHEIDVKDLATCYSMDVIGSCAFGFDCNSFTNPNSEFRKEGKKIFDLTSIVRRCKVGFAFWWPTLAQKLKITFFDSESIAFFTNLVKDTIQFREKNNVVRNDMIQILMDLKNGEEKNGNISYNFKEVAAEVFTFFAAGFETTSITLSFCLYELAKNPDMQEKLRNEVKSISIKFNDKITYEAIMNMKYMDQILDETLRKYPPVSFLIRKCVKDYKIPDTEVTLEKGMVTIIPIIGLHHDAEYYPEPEKFDPERFSEENKRQRPAFTYLPFAEGPRICIGLRFGIMQIKTALTVLLMKYRFSLNKKSTVSFEFEKYSYTLTPKGGIFLNIDKI